MQPTKSWLLNCFFTSLGVLSLCGCFPLVSVAADQKIITNFSECVAAGNAMLKMLPARCRTPDGREFIDMTGAAPKAGAVCKDLCGDGECQEMVCEAVGCPCAETSDSCPKDCSR